MLTNDFEGLIEFTLLPVKLRQRGEGVENEVLMTSSKPYDSPNNPFNDIATPDFLEEPVFTVDEIPDIQNKHTQ